MYLRRHLSSVCFWIFLAFLLNKNHGVASRHAQQTLTLFDQNTKEKNLKVKVKKSQAILEAKNDLQDAISCDCRDFCPDPNSSELQVSVRKLYKLIFVILLRLLGKYSSCYICVAFLHIIFGFGFR